MVAVSKRKTPTVAAKFHASLTNLMSVISHCNPFFVRCIKPNNTKVPKLNYFKPASCSNSPCLQSFAEFDRQLEVSQLNYLGVLETIKIRKLGYPIRMYFAAFISRYRCLMMPLYAKSSTIRTLQSREVCEIFLKSLAAIFHEEFQLGLSKVSFVLLNLIKFR